MRKLSDAIVNISVFPQKTLRTIVLSKINDFTSSSRLLAFRLTHTTCRRSVEQPSACFLTDIAACNRRNRPQLRTDHYWHRAMSFYSVLYRSLPMHLIKRTIVHHTIRHYHFGSHPRVQFPIDHRHPHESLQTTTTECERHSTFCWVTTPRKPDPIRDIFDSLWQGVLQKLLS